MSECNHDCSNCQSKGECSFKIEKLKLNEYSKIKHIVAVLSSKGGVGKSFVTSSIAVELAKRGFKVGILDADITGPSIPKGFGIKDKAYGDGNYIYPAKSRLGIKIISANMLLDDEKDPIIWRGGQLVNLLNTFLINVIWEELDYLLIDMPPGTGDVTLSTFQTFPLSDLIVVTSPQDLVTMVVTKAIRMAQMMNINVLGIVENMSYFVCPKCLEKHYLFGQSNVEKMCEELNVKLLAKLPFNNKNTLLFDRGEIENIDLQEIIKIVESLISEGK